MIKHMNRSDKFSVDCKESNMMVDMNHGHVDREEEGKGELKETEEVEVEEEESKPPDGGYGWFVVLGMFLSMLILGGMMKSSGLIFLQFQERFHAGALKAVWPGSIMATLANLVAPLASAVCNRYSVRTCVMLGSTMLFIGLVLNAFATDFYFLFFCHSLLQGAGLGFMVSPGVIIIASYFEKRRGFVTSLGTTGGSVGTFAIVPLVTFMFDYYGFEGTFLILSAIASHGFLVAFLYRPYSIHVKYSKIKKNKEVKAYTLNGNGNTSCVALEEFPEDSALVKQDLSNIHDTNHEEIPNGDANHSIFENPSQNERVKSCPRLRSNLKICFPSEHSRKENSKNRKIFHFNLLTDVSFVLHLLSVVFCTMATRATFMFIPALCVDKGLTKTDAALVLSISGAVDTFGRIGCGYVLDFPKLRPLRPIFYAGSLFGIGAAAFFIPFLDSFVSLTIACTVMGVSFGAYISQRAVVLVDMMGKEMLPSCIGLLRLFQSVGILLGPLIYGAISDATDSYDYAFYSGCGSLFISGILMVLSIIVMHFQTKREKSQRE